MFVWLSRDRHKQLVRAVVWAAAMINGDKSDTYSPQVNMGLESVRESVESVRP